MFSNRIILYPFSGLVIYLVAIVLSADRIDLDFILKNIFSLFSVATVFYINTLLVFPDYLPNRQYVAACALLALVCVLAIGIRFFLISFSPVILPPFDSIQFWNQFQMNLLFAGISFAYWSTTKNYQDQQYRQQLEKDVAEAKLTMLKNQINPHFLYNSLSLLYAKTLPLSDEVSELVGKISDMMRYALEEAGDNGLISLEKEVVHLKNYVDIQQMRFGNTLNVKFDIQGDMKKHLIAPLLLITFVENAFKHGKFNEAAHPVIITLKAGEREFVFFVKNRKAPGLKEKTGGIGLANVKSRLNLLYPANHMLNVTDDGESYSVTLKIHSIT